MNEQIEIFGQCINAHEYIDREGVYGIHFNKDAKVAVLKVGGNYFLPGGGKESQESDIECLQREFHEETGRDIEVIEFVTRMIQYHKSVNDGVNYRLIGNFYVVNMQEKKGKILEQDHELVWLDVDDIEKVMLLEYQAAAIKKAYRSIA